MFRAELTIVLIALAATGCATIGTAESSMRNRLEEGDEIVLGTREGERHQFTVSELAEVAIRGEDADGQSVEIRYEDVEWWELAKSSSGRSAGSVAGDVVMGLLLILALAGSAAGQVGMP